MDVFSATALTDDTIQTPNRGLDRPTFPLPFSFDGKRYLDYSGDAIASALLAYGVKIVGRGFKYRRPCGI
ncbi:MAG: 2Fe-2S iron-sulfur cluster-binding protein [Roseobacter sp.]